MQDTVTYKQLSSALSELGFKERRSGNFIVFHEASRDATVLIPVQAREGGVLSADFAAARDAVVGKGVADETRFDDLIARPEGDEPKPEESSEAAGHTPISFADALAFKSQGGSVPGAKAGAMNTNTKLHGTSKTKSGAANQAKGRVKK
jgi:hypothetical protein